MTEYPHLVLRPPEGLSPIVFPIGTRLMIRSSDPPFASRSLESFTPRTRSDIRSSVKLLRFIIAPSFMSFRFSVGREPLRMYGHSGSFRVKTALSRYGFTNGTRSLLFCRRTFLLRFFYSYYYFSIATRSIMELH